MRMLVVLLLVAMIVGCGKIHGTYYKKGGTDEHIKLLEDGTFSSKERPYAGSGFAITDPVQHRGRWSKADKLIQLSYEGGMYSRQKAVINCTLKGKVLTDEDGQVWVKR
jgi:hypothetical protein